MLEHGGRLRQAAATYGIALEHWLDLSTGINPHPYPVPPIPPAVWQRLPEDDDDLLVAATAYFGTDQLLAVAGSQPAIQLLPELIPGQRVSMPAPTYAEHPHAWRGRVVHTTGDRADQIEAVIDHTDVLLLVHPNNPTGACYERAQLLDWHRRLAQRGGWLVIDEAFIDAAPGASLAAAAGVPGLVVLRSIGKFFGLAGARAGFVLAPPALRVALAQRLGPWTVSGPARFVVAAALRDCPWQLAMQRRLAADSERLAALLHAAGLGPARGPALFQWVEHAAASTLQHALARKGILVRHFDSPSSLRFGLPADEAGWLRLAHALEACPIGTASSVGAAEQAQAGQPQIRQPQDREPPGRLVLKETT